MQFCNKCGEAIEFRYMNGVPKPIHINGGWCSGARSELGHSAPFRSVASYLNPNASCPVCGKSVFFFQSKYGGRIFFDDVGWPWPKHGCTDNGQPPSKATTSLRANSVIRDRHGNTFEIYNLDDLQEEPERFNLTFYNLRTRGRLDLCIKRKTLEKSGVKLVDLWDSPSFLLRRDRERIGAYRVEFISIRQQKVIRILMPRSSPA